MGRHRGAFENQTSAVEAAMNNRPFAEQNPANLINRRSPWQSDDIFFLIWRDGKPFCRFPLP